MSEIPNSTKDMILGGLLYFRNLREKYVAAMQGKHGTMLDPGVTSPYASVERTIQLYIRVDLDTSNAVIMRRLIEDMGKLPPANVKYKEELINILETLDNKELFTEQLCERHLDDVNRYMVVKETTEALKKTMSVPQLKDLLAQTESKLGQLDAPGKLKMYDPIAAASEVLHHVDKVPTGISFFDTLLGGGIVWGEHGGCLGPPSGGKSQLANMLACNIAIQGYNTMLLQFEQSVKHNSDIMARVYSYLTGLPMDEFRNKAYSELSDATKAALAKCAKVSSRMRVASFQDDAVERSVDAIINAIDENIEAGFKPKFVIIDWLGAVVSDFLAAGSGTDKNYPLTAQRVQDVLRSYGTKRGISFFFLHQTSNDAARKASGYKPEMHDSYFFGGFAMNLEYCLQLGTKHSVGDGKFALWLCCGKVRGAEPHKSTVILLNGQYARLEVTKEGEYVVNRRGELVSAEASLRVVGDTQAEQPAVNEIDSFGDNF